MKKKEIVLILKQKADSEQPKSDFSDFSSRLVQRTDSSAQRVKLIEMPDSPRRMRFPAVPAALAGSFAIVCGIIGFNALKEAPSVPVQESGIIVTADNTDKPDYTYENENKSEQEAEKIKNTALWKKSDLEKEDISEQNQYNYFKTAYTVYYTPSFENIDFTVSYALCQSGKATLTLEKKIGEEWLVTPYADSRTIFFGGQDNQNFYKNISLNAITSDGTKIYPDEGVYRLVLSAEDEIYTTSFVVKESSADNPYSRYPSDYSEESGDKLEGFEFAASDTALSEEKIRVNISFSADVTDSTVNITSGNEFFLERKIGGSWYRISEESFKEEGLFQLVSGAEASEITRSFDFGGTSLEAGIYRIVKSFDVYEEHTETGIYTNSTFTEAAEFALTDENGEMRMFSVQNIPYSSYKALAPVIYGDSVKLIEADGKPISDTDYIYRIVNAFSAIRLVSSESFEEAGFEERKLAFTDKNGQIYSITLYFSENDNYFIKADGEYFYIESNSALRTLLSCIERGTEYKKPIITEKPDNILDMDSIYEGEFTAPDCLTAGQAELLAKAYVLAEQITGLAVVENDYSSQVYVPQYSRLAYYKAVMPEFDSYEEFTEYAHSIMTDDVLNGLNFYTSFADVNNEIYHADGYARNSILSDYSYIEPVSGSTFRITNVLEGKACGDYYVTFSPVGDDQWIITEFQLWI